MLDVFPFSFCVVVVVVCVVVARALGARSQEWSHHLDWFFGTKQATREGGVHVAGSAGWTSGEIKHYHTLDTVWPKDAVDGKCSG